MKMKKFNGIVCLSRYSLIILLLFGVLTVRSQEHEYEKQLAGILTITPAQKKIDSLEVFSKFVVFQDYVMGKKASMKLLEFTRHGKNKRQLLTTYNILGLATHYSGETEQALLIFDTLIKTAIEVKDTLMEAKGHGNCGLVYERLGNFKEAFSQYTYSLKCAEKLGNKSMKASAFGNLGNVSIRLGKFNEAILYLNNSAQLFIELDNKKAIANQYNSISQAYDGLKDIKSQVEYLRKAEAIYRSIDEKRALGTVLINLGSIEADYFHNTSKSIQILEEALKLKRETDDENGMATVYVNLTAQYTKEGKFSKAFASIAEARKVAESQNDLFLLSNVLQKTSMIYRMTGDYKNAYRYYDEHVKVKDSILGQETQKAVAEYKEMYESEKKQYQIDKLQKTEEINKLEIIKNEEQLKREKAQRFLIFGVLICVVIICIVLVRAFIQKRNNANILQNKNELINAKNAALQSANMEIINQKEIIEEKQKEIVDSINYAKKIQYALLAHDDMLKQHLLEHFIFFKPKDIVSGDFYWATEHDNKFYLAVCDSTGHGVPGAFMSLLNIGFLNEAIKEKNISQPNEVLNYVRTRLMQSIGNDGQQDGMDAILLCIDRQQKIITYAAANNEPVLIRNNEVVILPKDKMPVGKGEKMDTFTLQIINLQANDVLYLYTDGYIDQFGGPKGKKFKSKQLNDFLLANSTIDLNRQSEVLTQEFNEWKGNLEQVDDICVIGIKF
ncbi:MAG: protein serine/threonine phosphatase [Bacteroidetes bacterium]|jgi:serine phosphatase RsbU (regulator of sigma subunit)|nr:protein serine/threonine phosphatase [Bacteroidota bacterium]MDF2452972.1 protein serine/threonine phosphatase [Bacteroidota bacterium]